MSDGASIALTTALYSGGAGLVGWGIAYLMRRRSLRLATISIALVAVLTLVAGLVGTSRAMFISQHDLGVTTEVVVVAGIVALLFAAAVGENLSRRTRDLRLQARDFGADTGFTPPTNAPVEFAALARELESTSQRLSEAQERERLMEGSRRELVAWVSHDLRTPLAGLRAMAEALEDGMVDDPARYHARIRGEVERMGRMVDDLFELSRIHAGAFQPAPEDVLLGDLVSDALAAADPIAQSRGVKLSGSVEDGLVVSVDAAGMSRVLLNLITNAIRHTTYDGAVHVVGRSTPAGVELNVEDACGGIPDEELSRVFDVAWRGSAAREPVTTGRSGGAGLGLAIVKGIV
ncbi:MAG: two-component system histidine kinase, partial [Nocardioidaceae bacterium]|nr:two-component system histidine kinase [Nocardioidaceae bacterium]